MADAFRLSVDGREFSGWTSANARLSIDEVASGFAVDFRDRWTPRREPWYITPDSECELYLDTDRLATGYVVDFDYDIDAANIRLSCQGYSKPGLLVEASAAHKTGHWRGVDPVQIINDLVSPFGISALVDVDTYKILRFDLEDGETVVNALERLCQTLAAVMYSDADGNLVVAQSSSWTTVKRLPARHLRCNIRASNQGRHSHYLSKGQLASTENFYGPETVLQTYEAQDTGVSVFKPLIIPASGPGGKKALQQRAEFERNIRAGRSRAVTLTYAGARFADGSVFRPGVQVHFEEPYLEISADMIVASVDYDLGDNGLLSTLTLLPKTTYSALELPEFAWRKRGR